MPWLLNPGLIVDPVISGFYDAVNNISIYILILTFTFFVHRQNFPVAIICFCDICLIRSIILPGLLVKVGSRCKF